MRIHRYDTGPARAAKGGFPYPGHPTMAVVMEREAREKAVRKGWYARNRKKP